VYNTTTITFQSGPYTKGSTFTYKAEASDKNNNTAQTQTQTFTVANPQQGIPGYPIEALILGLTISTIKIIITKNSIIEK
jgi:hypothetical protein